MEFKKVTRRALAGTDGLFRRGLVGLLRIVGWEEVELELHPDRNLLCVDGAVGNFHAPPVSIEHEGHQEAAQHDGAQGDTEQNDIDVTLGSLNQDTGATGGGGGPSPSGRTRTAG